MRPRGNLIVVGPFGSGKSTLATLIAGETGGEVLELGEIVRAEARREVFDGPMIDFAERRFERDGELWIVDIAMSRHDLGRGGFVVVGPRTPAEVDFLGAQAETLVVGLTADRPVRLARRLAQMRPGEGCVRRLAERDLVEHEWGMDLCLRSAELAIDTGRTSVSVSLRRILSAWAQATTVPIAP